MHILAVGMNHNTAPVDVRERASLAPAQLERVLECLQGSRTTLESVVLSTCNRTEIYAVVSSLRAGEDYLIHLLAAQAGMDPEAFQPYTYTLPGSAAVRHLLAVAAGLDSMVIGETQILGQVRDAYQLALSTGNTGSWLNHLFRMAAQLGKRAQTETAVGRKSVSISSAAVDLAKQAIGDLQGKSAVIVGAGKMAELAARHLRAHGVGQLTVVSRTALHAMALAADMAASAYTLTQLPEALTGADVVISATGAPGIVMTAADVRTARQSANTPVVIIDIAVPRDVDPDVAALPHVTLYDIDHLDGVMQANLGERRRHALWVERMIDVTLDEYSTWLSEQAMVPLIRALRAKGLGIQDGVMASLERKLPDLSERERLLIHKHMMSVVNQLLRDPVLYLKELASAPDTAERVPELARLFGVSMEDWDDLGQDVLAEQEQRTL